MPLAETGSANDPLGAAREPIWLGQNVSPATKDKAAAPESQRIFGQNLKAARIRAGMTQDDLAAASGRSRSLIYQTEDGKRNLLFQTADDLAKALNVTLVQLLQPPCKSGQEGQGNSMPVTGKVPVSPNTLAIELPTSAAFEAAMAVAACMDQPVSLIDPVSRDVRGFVPKPAKHTQD